MSTPLSEFSRPHGPSGADNCGSLAAGLLTGILYASFVVLAWWFVKNAPAPPAKPEITASILPDGPSKRVIEPLPPFLAHLIRPHAEKPALPVFTIASGAPPQAPAPLPASAAKSSPMPGGTDGTGQVGQAASGNGAGGNGGVSAGCLDPIWMRAVTERIRQFFYYPQAALSSRTFGVVLVHFVVHRDGHLSALEIGKSSGTDMLDKAAYDMVRSAAPLPPMPDRMHVEQVDGQLAINFGVRGFNGAPTIDHCD